MSFDRDENYFFNFLNMDCDLPEEDVNDDDYNVLEDILTNQYKDDEEPYYLSIPKKELNDIMNDAIKTEPFLQKNSSFSSKEVYHSSGHGNSSKHFGDISNLNKSFLKENSDFDENGSGAKKAKRKIKKALGQAKKQSNNIKKMQRSLEESLNKDTLKQGTLSNKTELNNNCNKNLTFISMNNNGNVYQGNHLDSIPEENKAINQMDFYEKLIFLLKQYDLFLQLLIQNLMLVDSKELKYRCYSILFQFYYYKQKIVENFKFPLFNIKFGFNDIFFKREAMPLRLQLSFYQPPILEILPIIMSFLSKKSFTKEETIKILKEFSPFINQLYLPITNKFKHSPTYLSSNENFLKKKVRRKFDSISDNLLLIGIKTHGKKNIDTIQQLWLPSRTTDEIKHRIKNLTCQSAPENIIKRNKRLNETLLPVNEFLSFIKGIEWFGFKGKWNIISRYFLPERSSEYLEELFIILVENKLIKYEDENEIKKYKKRNIIVDQEILKAYKATYQDKLDNLTKNISSIEGKDVFYSPEATFENFKIPSRITKENESHVNTRGKTNGTTGHKGRNPGFDFQIGSSEDGTFEKITL